jgi:HSP20 family molecular chaperone IbpA
MFLTKYTPNLYPMGANFDRMFEELFETSFKDAGVNKYPATDVYTEGGVTHIEVAVTGFSEDDIEVSLENDILSIKGSKEEKTEHNDRNYHTKNIAQRSFIRKFTISDSIEDVKAEIKNGVLHLELVQKEKEETKKLIKINK